MTQSATALDLFYYTSFIHIANCVLPKGRSKPINTETFESFLFCCNIFFMYSTIFLTSPPVNAEWLRTEKKDHKSKIYPLTISMKGSLLVLLELM